MKVWRTIDNFLSQQEASQVFKEKTFKPFTCRWHDLPSKSFYHNKVLDEVKDEFADITNAIGLEEWHQDAHWFLPEEHVDKDEVLYAETGETRYPLCSAILYLQVDNLVGGNLKLVRDDVEIIPTTGKLVLLAPGVLHKITDFISGKRISLNLNIWDKPLNIS